MPEHVLIENGEVELHFQGRSSPCPTVVRTIRLLDWSARFAALQKIARENQIQVCADMTAAVTASPWRLFIQHRRRKPRQGRAPRQFHRARADCSPSSALRPVNSLIKKARSGIFRLKGQCAFDAGCACTPFPLFWASFASAIIRGGGSGMSPSVKAIASFSCGSTLSGSSVLALRQLSTACSSAFAAGTFPPISNTRQPPPVFGSSFQAESRHVRAAQDLPAAS